MSGAIVTHGRVTNINISKDFFKDPNQRLKKTVLYELEANEWLEVFQFAYSQYDNLVKKNNMVMNFFLDSKVLTQKGRDLVELWNLIRSKKSKS